MHGLPESNPLEMLLKERFGLPGFRHGQLETLQSVLSDHDTLAVMPTGGGKSLCYQFPAAYRDGIVLVISPLIALMRDQVLGLRERGIRAGALHSGQSREEKQRVFAELRTETSYLLYLSPERVQKDGFVRWFQDANISLIAIDEAHCISQWGPDFRPDYHRLEVLRKLRPDIPILATTATATPQVLNDISRQLQMKKPRRHVYGFYRPNLYYQVEYCENDFQKRQAVCSALAQFPHGRVIIYCGTRKVCEELSGDLSDQFERVAFYHAGMDSKRRVETEKKYECGEIRVLVATNAFGMGVDHPDVRLIVHYQMTANIDSYYQEMGRAGRDGEDSTCLLLYARKDKGLQSYFIQQSKAPPWIRSAKWRSLEAMVQYAEGGECRHSGILTYFRDEQRIEECGHCDVCAPNSDRRIQFDLRSVPEPELPKKVRKKSGKPPKKSVKLGPLSAEEKQRAEAIREWRYQYAKSKDIPAFLVFSNKTLEDLARKNPNSRQSLLRVHGIGEQKVDQFGEDLLKLLT